MPQLAHHGPSELRQTAALRAAFLAHGRNAMPEAPPGLVDAWERSRAAGVDPERVHVPLVLEGRALHDHADAQAVYRAGVPVLETAAGLLADTRYGLILADREGIVLHLTGDPGLSGAAERVGSLPGATWQEAIAGNNAIGTALVTGTPVQFRYHEHWCAGWTDWTCAAAPVSAPGAGPVLGIVCLCGYRRPLDPGMLTMAVRLAGAVHRQLGREFLARQAGLKAEAARLKRWFPGQPVLAVDCHGSVVWREGAVPPALIHALSERPLALVAAKLRGEREILVGGRYPCLAIPVWEGMTWLGHLLVVAQAAVRTHPPGSVNRIVALSGERRLLFTSDQILAARVAAGRVLLITDSGEWPTPYQSMGDLQGRLPEAGFFQVDRNCLVNLGRIREIHPMFNRTVNLVLADRKGTRIAVSRRRTSALRDLLEF